MFKNLKKKLEQGVAQSRVAVSAISNRTKDDDSADLNASSESFGKPQAESTPQKDKMQQQNNSASSVPTGQLVDIPLSEEHDSTHYETASDLSSLRGEETPRGNRSRTSSISSMTSDSSFFPNISFSHNYYVPSDVESEIEDTNVNLSSVSKEDLYAFVKRFEKRAFKYKTKFMELATAYKDMMQEKEKLKTTITQTQDRAFRRMSELREQSQLDKLAKRDIEENYRLLLDEKDEYMKVLQTQVKLLKEGKEIPDELKEQLESKQAKAEAAPPSSTDTKSISNSEEVELLKSKIKRQDGLLQKCKETITNYKDKVTQLTLEKQQLVAKTENTSSDATNPAEITKLQGQIRQAKELIQQLESDREVAIASVKHQMHEEMEKKDSELEQLKSQNSLCLTENNTLKVDAEKLANTIDDLRKTNHEQLDKAREIMRRLKDEKKQALEQTEERIKEMAASMEEEKEKMIGELKRGKTEAISIMQEELKKQFDEKLESALDEKDIAWNEKIAALNSLHTDELNSKDRDKESALSILQEEIKQKIQEKDEDVRLSLEERELQKMAAIYGMDEQKDELQRKIEEKNSDNIELQNRFAKFQEDSEQKINELTEELAKTKEEHVNSVDSMKQKHETKLNEMKTQLEQEAEKERTSLVHIHTEELEKANSKHTEALQQSMGETENYYKNETERTKSEMQELFNETKSQLEESRTSLAHGQEKCVHLEKELHQLKEAHASKEKEHSAQIAVSNALIDGKNKEFDSLASECDKLKHEISEKCKLLEDTTGKLNNIEEECNRMKEQLHQSKGESTSKLDELFAERETLIKKVQDFTAEKVEFERKLTSQEESNKDLNSKFSSVIDDLSQAHTEVHTLKSQLAALQTELSNREEDLQQRISQTLHETTEKDKMHLSETQSRANTIAQLESEIQGLKEQLGSKTSEIEETVAKLAKATEEKTEVDLKKGDLEAEVSQLKGIITSLESCQSKVETEKVHLEEELTRLEDIVTDLKKSKEELNEKLDARHQSLLQQSADRKQELEAQASVLASQVEECMEQINTLNKATMSKDDEIMAIRSVIEDNAAYIKTVETKNEELKSELVLKTQILEETEGKLAKGLEKFEKLKVEANVKVKGLKEMKDSLTEKLEMREKEGLETVSANAKQKEELQKQFDEKLQAQQEEMKALEQSFKERFEERQAKHKDTMAKVKERYEEKMKEQEQESEKRLIAATEQSQQGFEELKRSLQEGKEKETNEMIMNQKEEFAEALSGKEIEIAELTSKLQDIQRKLEEEAKPRIQELSAQVDSLNGHLSEKTEKLELMAGTISAEHEALHRQLTSEKDRSTKLQSLVEKHQSEVQEKDMVLSEKHQQLSQLQMEYSSMEEMLKAITDTAQEKDKKISSLEESVEDFKKTIDEKESSLANIMSETESLKLDNDAKMEELENCKKNELEDLHQNHTTQLSEMTQTHKAQLEDERAKFERQETALNEQIATMKQQLDASHAQAEMASNELQAKLQQRVKEMEDELLEKMKSHQEKVESVRQENDQKVKELKQKYVVKLKEIQGSSKATIEELEANLKCEKASKEEMNSELTRANTRLLQMEENSGLTKDTMVDLEHKVVDMTSEIKEMDSELSQLKSEAAEREKNIESILNDTQSTCEVINSKLSKTESNLKEKEAECNVKERELQNTLDELDKKTKTIEHQNTSIEELQRLNAVFDSENLKLQETLQTKESNFTDLESVLNKTKQLLDEAQNHKVQLETQVQTASANASKHEEEQNEKLHLKNKLAEREKEKEQLEKTVSDLENELLSKVSALQSLEKEFTESKNAAEVLKQKHESEMQVVKDSHASTVEEMSSKLENQGSAKVADYKKKAEVYISQVKKQLQTEKNTAVSQLQETISKHEETISVLSTEIEKLKKEAEDTAVDRDQKFEAMKNELGSSAQEKESVIEEHAQKERDLLEYQSLQEQELSRVNSERDSLKEELSSVKNAVENDKVQYNEQIKGLETKNNAILKEIETVKKEKDELKSQYEDEMKEQVRELDNNQKLMYEKMESEQTTKIKQLVKEMNKQLAEKERDFDLMFREALDKSERGEQGMRKEHETDLKDVQKELDDRDERIQELHEEYASKLENAEKNLKEEINRLKAELTDAKKNHQHELFALEEKLKSDQQKSLFAKETVHKQEVSALTSEWNYERKQSLEATNNTPQRAEVVEEMVQQNQAALQAFQNGSKGNTTSLQKQVIQLTQEIEQLKEKHKLEMADVHGVNEMASASLVSPLLAAPNQQHLGTEQTNMAIELQDLELHNMDLQAQVSQLNGELGQQKMKERELLRKLEKCDKTSKGLSDDEESVRLDRSYLNHDDSSVFREPTELEYLKNILYEYMMGKETKTLAKVIATVIRFNEEQTRNIVARAESRMNWLSP